MSDSLQHEWDLKSVDFPLTESSMVFEIGGYVGRWAKEIGERYNPLMHVFEPQEWAAVQAFHATENFPNVMIHNFGLGVESGKFPMGNWETDGCSLVNIPADKPSGEGKLKEFGLFLRSNNIQKIDLCLMNIEGYEFKLIPYMIETGIMDKIDYFMCQFHLFDRNEQAYYDIRKELGKTKKIRFDYGPILTCWEPK